MVCLCLLRSKTNLTPDPSPHHPDTSIYRAIPTAHSRFAAEIGFFIFTLLPLHWGGGPGPGLCVLAVLCIIDGAAETPIDIIHHQPRFVTGACRSRVDITASIDVLVVEFRRKFTCTMSKMKSLSVI